jgi:hypothetical protein
VPDPGPLPTFLICGAPKAGTTALYEYCRQHPDVLMSTPKETGFFHKNHHKGVDWFRAHFQDWGGETAIGEASVMTMPTPGAEKRVADLIPDARLIFLLRDPVERAYSDYLFNVQQGWIPPDVSFGRIIRDEVEVKDYSGKALINRGLYLKHLRRFREHFRRSQMRILLARDLKHETSRVVRSVYTLVGVEEDFSTGALERHNTTSHMRLGSVYRALRAGWQPVKAILGDEGLIGKVRDQVRTFFFASGKKPEMRPEDREYLKKRFEKPNSRLSEWSGKDLSHWT